jgi:hypothetical protein
MSTGSLQDFKLKQIVGMKSTGHLHAVCVHFPPPISPHPAAAAVLLPPRLENALPQPLNQI